MKICFVIGSMNYSGAEKVLSMIVDEIKHEHDVHVVLLEMEFGACSVENGVSLHGARADGSRIRRLLKRWNNIGAIVAELQPDIVVSFGYVCNVNTIMALWRCKTPLVVCERNDPVYDPRKATEKAARSLLYRFADGYVFQTETIKHYFSKQIQGRSCVIPNPISAPATKWIREKAENKFVTVARLDDFQKDQTMMIEAFSDFLKVYPDYSLEIYGDGPSKEDYRRLIEKLGVEDKVFLMGKTNDASKVVATSRAFLLTSVFEGMPNALIEAMAVGAPCISTDCGGGGAAALRGYCEGVLLIPVGSRELLVHELRRIVEDEEMAQRLSNNASKIVDVLDKKKVANQWLDYLHRLSIKK